MKQFRFLYGKTVEKDYNWMLNSDELNPEVTPLLRSLVKEYENTVDRRKQFPPIYLAFCYNDLWHACTYYVPDIKDIKGRKMVALAGVCWEIQGEKTDRSLLLWAYEDYCKNLKFIDDAFVDMDSINAYSGLNIEIEELSSKFESLLLDKKTETNISTLLDGHTNNNIQNFSEYLLDGNISNPIYFGPTSEVIRGIQARLGIKLEKINDLYTKDQDQKQGKGHESQSVLDDKVIERNELFEKLDTEIEDVELSIITVSVDVYEKRGLFDMLINFLEKLITKKSYSPFITVEINGKQKLVYSLDQISLKSSDLKYIIRDSSNPASKLINKELSNVAQMLEKSYGVYLSKKSDFHYHYIKKES